MKLEHFIILVMLSLFVGCGSPGSGKGVEGEGVLSIKVSGIPSFDANIEHGMIDMYRITISDSDIEGNIVAEFSGDADEGVVEGVPTGRGRQIVVEAINQNGEIVRIGEVYDVDVGSGMNDVEVWLDSVPVFANLRDGGVVQNTRLRIRLFSDPSHSVIVDAISDGETSTMTDVSSNLSEIYSDESTWQGSLSPGLLAPGEFSFMARDLTIGRGADISLTLIDGDDAKPAPLFSGSSTNRFSSSSISMHILSEVVR